ncbi:MAG TPA: hypothetical protein VK436_17365 [Methanocella sp.]|nr:hypothetical protein [Methanocella sp.]
MASFLKTFNAYATPFIFIIWVVCGIVLVLQYKGMLPWFEGWQEQLILIVTFVPPILLSLYAVAQIVKKATRT